MKKKMNVVRISEAFFLFVFCFTLIITNKSFHTEFNLISFEFWFKIGLKSTDPVQISSLILGYILTINSVYLRGIKNFWEKALLVFAILGCLGYANEVLRLFGVWEIQFLVNFPFAVVLIDWIRVSQAIKKLPTTEPAPSTEPINS